MFNTNSKTSGREQSDITGMIGQYAQGNEPSHHIPYLFSKIDSTAKYVKKICNELYQPTPDGLCGNEDCGQMSAWYVFSAMGFYPVNPSLNKFKFGYMIFDSVLILNKEFLIIKDSSLLGENTINSYDLNLPKYDNEGFKFPLREVSISGSSKRHLFVKGKSVINDTLQLKEYKPVPNEAIILHFESPIIAANSNVFNDSLSIRISSNSNNIYLQELVLYKINDGEYQLYNGNPITIYKNTKITSYKSRDSLFWRQLSKGEDKRKYTFISDLSVAHFYKRPNNYTVKINSIYNKQYTADGDDGLIDGLLGDTDWRKGRWQGYQSQDFEAIVDLQTTKTVNKISGGFLQDSRSWILFPKQVAYYGSVDGIIYELIDSVASTVPANDMNVQRAELSVKGNGKQYRYIKVQALNFGQLPAWHQGAGGDAFIFVDEIRIE